MIDVDLIGEIRRAYFEQRLPIGVIYRTSELRPALVAAPEHPSPTNEHQEDRAGRIEIELPNGVRVHVDRLVNEKALSRVRSASA